MRVIVAETSSAVDIVASALVAHVAASPKSVVGFATGATMEAVYRCVTDYVRTGAASFAATTSFNLDEYVGLDPLHPASYHSTMRRLLFSHIDIDLRNTHIPNGAAPSPEREATAYEALIADAGGIDFQLLGLGRNGHIGFNEPGSTFDSRTRIVDLACETRQANRVFFSDNERVPRQAITMGVATIFAAKQIVLLALGAEKAKALVETLEGPISPARPGSILRRHPNVLVVADNAAGCRLRASLRPGR